MQDEIAMVYCYASCSAHQYISLTLLYSCKMHQALLCSICLLLPLSLVLEIYADSFLILFALLCLCSITRYIIIAEAIETEFLILKVNYPIELPIPRISGIVKVVIGIFIFFLKRIKFYKDRDVIQLPNSF